jgi:hypothetical protein
MKTLKFCLLFVAFTFSVHTVTAQDDEEGDNFWVEFFDEVLSNYSEEEVSKIEALADEDTDIITNLAMAYMDIVTPINDYGTGLSDYKYTLPSDGKTQIGFCQGWTANFFYMTKKGDNTHTQYIKLWQVGSSKIITEDGVKYLMIYPVDSMLFEKRSWMGEDAETAYSEVKSIKFYMDWSKEAGLIEKMNAGFDVWGKFNNKVRK